MRFRLATQGYLLIGLGLGAVAWFLEALIHALFFEQQHLLVHLFAPDAHELWKRLLVAGLLVIFSIFAQHGINVRRRTEEALSTSEKRYRTLIEEALNPVFVVDAEGRFIEHNSAAVQFFALDEAAMAATTVFDLLPPLRRTSGVGSIEVGEIEVDYRTGGQTKTLVLNLVPLSTGDGAPSFVGIGQDITDRKQVERNLKVAHAELEQIFRTASAAMRLIDRDSRVLKANQPFVTLAGVSEEDAVGSRCFETFAGDKCHTDDCPLNRILDGEAEVEYEIRKTRSDGSSVTCLLTARPFLGSDGEPQGIVESFKDITELARVQEELRTERDRLHHILFQRFEGVGIIRPDHTLEYLNPTLVAELGDRHGEPCYAVIRGRDKPCQPCFMKTALRTGKLQQSELDVAGGRTHEHTYTSFVDATGEEKALLLLRDVTERRTARAAVIRSDQLAALGELAAGVAHEINNPINGIINDGQMLVTRERDLDEVQLIGQHIVSEGDRVAAIVESLLSFARRDSDAQAPTSIGKLLVDSLTLIGAQLRKDSIVVSVDIARDMPEVLCVPQEIQQVFLNVLSNARYALNTRYPESDPGKTLEITAAADDTGVVVAIVDAGIGIPAVVLDKITNPFFSTKPKGQGTGLGLSISHQAVERHGGSLAVESVEGEYTRVTISLPALIPTGDGVRPDEPTAPTTLRA